MSQFISSNLDQTLDFDAMPIPTTIDGGPWGYNTESAAANQDDILEQFLNNFPASTTNSI